MARRPLRERMGRGTTHAQPRGFQIFVALLLGLALVASACGDDDDSDTTGAAEGGGRLRFAPYDVGGPLTKAALKSGDIQVALLFTSDADIAIEDWVLLEDDKKLQPAENLIPAIRESVSTPEIQAALDAVSEQLTTDELTELNRQQSQDKQDSDAIAKAWLEDKGLVPYDGDSVTGSITVGSTNFGEQEIVAELYAQILESAGADVTRTFKLGNREVVAPALAGGEIDIYPEYIGSYMLFLDPEATVPTDTDEAVTQLAGLAEAEGVVLAAAAAAEDKNGFVVTRSTADKYSLTKVSDLATVTDELVLGGPPECPERPHCAIGLTETYGLTINS
jgi:osmoprotectant transport system substrate-binding protein